MNSPDRKTMECKRGKVYKAPQRGRGTTSGQMIKSWGAFWALLGLLAIVAFGLWLDLSHGCLAGARRCASAHASNGKIDLSPLLKLGEFLEDHNGAVSAVAAIFLAVFTIVLAWKTAGLNAATRGLQDFARIQSEDAKRSIAEAARAAGAMESVAASLDVNAKMIVQAWRPIRRSRAGRESSARGKCARTYP